MIQLKNKNIIILGFISIIILAGILLAIIKIRDKKVDPENKYIGLPGGRVLSDEEKTSRGINTSEKVQVVNDQGGLFIYKVVK